MREGHSSIHLAHQTRDAWHLKPIEAYQLKPRLPNEPVNRSVHVTADADFLLQGIEPILPFYDPRTVTAAVLEEYVLPAWLEHAANLPKSGHDVRDGAERPSTHDAVESEIVEWKSLG